MTETRLKIIRYKDWDGGWRWGIYFPLPSVTDPTIKSFYSWGEGINWLIKNGYHHGSQLQVWRYFDEHIITKKVKTEK